jgi:hypothetical protein
MNGYHSDSSLQRSASLVGATEYPEWTLVSDSPASLKELIKELKDRKSKKLVMERLIQALEEVYANCSEGKGHDGDSDDDEAGKKKKKGQKQEAAILPTRGSDRLQRVAMEHQQRLQERAAEEVNRKTRRARELEQRAEEYQGEMLMYLKALTKAINIMEGKYEEEENETGEDDLEED